MTTIPSGCYIKHDGGVQFTIADGMFTFNGSSQRMCTTSDATGPAFTISWEWGEPTFVLQPDEVTLLENGVHSFRRIPTTATTEQLCHLRDAGYLVVHDCVSHAAVAAALRCTSVQDAILQASESASWIDGGGCDPALLALAVPIWPTVRSIVGDDAPLPSWAQVAVKAPGGAGALPGYFPPDAHIDGLHAPNNGVPEGAIHNFTLLVGIALTDMPAPNMGNLGVVPCSHRALARAVGSVGLEQAAATLSARDGASATERLSRLLPLRCLAPPLPLCMLRGAAVLAHYSTVHFVQPNSAGVAARVMVYFRVTSPARSQDEACSDLRMRLEVLSPEGLYLEQPGLASLPA
jgi:hypothetical protein